MSTRNTRNRPGRRARAIALCSALVVYVVGMLGAAWHDAVERHGICEHGERVHAAEIREDSQPHADDSRPQADGGAESTAPRLAPGGGASESHEHCLVWSPSKRPADPTPAAPEPAAPREIVVRVEPPRSEIERAFPLFLLAPGRSPPAA